MTSLSTLDNNERQMLFLLPPAHGMDEGHVQSTHRIATDCDLQPNCVSAFHEKNLQPRRSFPFSFFGGAGHPDGVPAFLRSSSTPTILIQNTYQLFATIGTRKRASLQLFGATKDVRYVHVPSGHSSLSLSLLVFFTLPNL